MYSDEYDEYGNKIKKKRKKGFLWVILVVILLLVTNFATFYITKYFPVFTGKSVIINADDELAAKNINKMIYLIGQLKDNFLWDVDEQDLWDGALKGLMEGTGDPYSEYMTQEEYADYQQTASGTYSGIGVQITNNDDGNVEITKVYKDTPAYQAGLEVGDVLSAAGDISLVGMKVSNAVTYIRGEAGTSVTLTYVRGGEVYTADVERRSIEVIYCEWRMVSDDIGYMYISEFEENTYDQFSAGIKELTAAGMKGLILDLRQNPGGLVSAAQSIADDLLPQADIVYLEDKSGKRETYTSDADSLGIPVVLLVDGYSASSSEILTVALHDNNAASVVGTQTYGKGIVQVLIPLSDNSLYKYTYAEYYGPSGTKIHGIGITPDYVVEKKEGTENKLIEDISYEDDLQLQKAVEVMNEKLGK